MNVFYYKTASGKEPVREYINNLQRDDRISIAGDLELIREFGILDAPGRYSKTGREIMGNQDGGKATAKNFLLYS